MKTRTRAVMTLACLFVAGCASTPPEGSQEPEATSTGEFVVHLGRAEPYRAWTKVTFVAESKTSEDYTTVKWEMLQRALDVTDNYLLDGQTVARKPEVIGYTTVVKPDAATPRFGGRAGTFAIVLPIASKGGETVEFRPKTASLWTVTVSPYAVLDRASATVDPIPRK